MIKFSSQARPFGGSSFRQLRVAICASVTLALIGCAGHRSRSSAGVDASQQVESDSARGSDFARLFTPGDSLLLAGMSPESGFPTLPRDLRNQNLEASMLFAVIVDSAGRIESASRTLVGSTGDPRVVKAWCDFLITARLHRKAEAPGRTMTLLPIIYFTAFAPAGEMPPKPTHKGMDPQPLVAMLNSMTSLQRQQWFADQQPCSSFKPK